MQVDEILGTYAKGDVCRIREEEEGTDSDSFQPHPDGDGDYLHMAIIALEIFRSRMSQVLRCDSLLY